MHITVIIMHYNIIDMDMMVVFDELSTVDELLNVINLPIIMLMNQYIDDMMVIWMNYWMKVYEFFRND